MEKGKIAMGNTGHNDLFKKVKRTGKKMKIKRH